MTVLGPRKVLQTEILMTWITHIVGAKTEVKGRGATEHALPIDLVGTVLVTISRACAYLFKKAILAHEIFFLCVSLLLVSHLILTVN